MKIAMPWRSIGLALGALAIAAVPVFLVTSNVRWAFNEPRLYDYSFSRFNVSASTGFPDSELRRAAREIVEYWGSDAELLDIRVDGEPLYTEREIIHMRDVKGLVQAVSWAPVVTGGLVLAYALGGLALQGRRFLPVLANRALVRGWGVSPRCWCWAWPWRWPSPCSSGSSTRSASPTTSGCWTPTGTT